MNQKDTGSDSKPSDSAQPRTPERRPHRSGQEYEYGETPETGLGGGGVGSDPDKAYARRREQPASEVAQMHKPATPTRQNGGGAENSGFARGRGDSQEVGKGGRRAQYDDDNLPADVKGQHGVPPEIEER